jgi:hypothetical protein
MQEVSAIMRLGTLRRLLPNWWLAQGNVVDDHVGFPPPFVRFSSFDWRQGNGIVPARSIMNS